MGANHDEDDGMERRRESLEVGRQLARICATLEALKEQIAVQYTSIKTWQAGRDEECKKIEEDIVGIRIELAKLGLKVAAYGVGCAMIMSIATTVIANYLLNKH